MTLGIVGVDRRARILPVRAIKIKAGPSGIIEKLIGSGGISPSAKAIIWASGGHIRTGNILALLSTPTIPLALLPTAAIIPATEVPWLSFWVAKMGFEPMAMLSKKQYLEVRQL
jgi:hypothetical protein